MDKQTYQQPYQQSLNRSFTFGNSRATGMIKPSIPEKKISSDVVNQIFAEVTTGNYLKLKDFLLANQLTLSARSEKGESVLHLIISNSNISQKEKLQLVEFAIKYGAPVNLPNENNITPLHLACSQQLYDVIDLLIKNGAVVNFKDSQFKTPLHYAISGESTQCKNEDDTKVKPLIPKTHIKHKEIESDPNIEDLQINLKNSLIDDPNTKKFIIHIKNTIDNVKQMYLHELEPKFSDAQNSIAEVIIDKSIKGDKTKAIFDKVMTEKKKILEFINQKVGSGIAPLTIKPGIYDGWGPNNSQENRVLEYKDLLNILADIDNSAKNEVFEANTEANELQETINEKITSLNKIKDVISSAIQQSHIYQIVIAKHINPAYNYGVPIDLYRMIRPLLALLFTDVPTAPIESTILRYPGKIFPNFNPNFNDPVNPDNNTTYIVKPTWNMATGIEEPEIDANGHIERVYMTIPSIRTQTIRHKQNIRIAKEKDNKKEEAERAEKDYLTSEYPLTHGLKFKSNPSPGSQPLGELLELGNSMSYNGIQNTAGLYFDTVFKTHIIIINVLFNDLKEVLSILYAQMNAQNLNEAILTINECLTIMLSILLTLSKVDEQKPVLNDKLTNIKLHFANLKDNDRLPNRSPNDLTFLPEQIIDIIENTEQEITKISGTCNNLYTSVIDIARILNRYLLGIQRLSVSTIFDSYYRANTFDTFYTENKITQFANIIEENPIELIPELPKTLEDFIKITGPAIPEAKKILLDQFIPQITTKNLIAFQKILPPGAPDTKPRVGFIQLEPDINLATQDSPVNSVRMLNKNTHVYENLPLQIKEQKNANTIDPFVNADVSTLIGLPGKKKFIRYNKVDVLPLVIGLELNRHLLMLRYSIVRYCIKKVYDCLETPFVGVNPVTVDDKLNVSVNKIRAKIESLVPFDQNNYSFLFVLVGKYVDEVLINIINEMLSINVSKLALALLETDDRIPKDYLRSISAQVDAYYVGDNPVEIIGRSKVIVGKKDTGFSADMTKLFNSTLNLYSTKRFIKSKKINAVTAGDLNDPPKKQSNVVKLINFNYAINSIEKTCFKVDPNIIKLLLSKGAYVNDKDILGNCPIYYAIEMQNKDVIDLLLSHGSVVYNSKFNNKFGKNILDETWESYSQIVTTLMVNKYEVCDTLTKNLVDKFTKQEYKNNIPKYTNILLHTALYMLNHQLYMVGKGYPKSWSFVKSEQLEKLLNVNTQNILPLLDNISIGDTELSRLEIPNMYANQIKKLIEDESDKLVDFTNKLQNLTDEENMLLNKMSKSENDKKRLSEITMIVTDVRQKMTAVKTSIKANKQMLSKVQQSKTAAFGNLKNFINANKSKVIRDADSVTKTYESVFKNVINSGNINILNNIYDFTIDTKTYPMIWKKFIEQTKSKLSNCSCQGGAKSCKHDYTQILDNLFCFQQKILSSSETNLISDKLSDLRFVVGYYDNVINPFIADYFDLPREYEGDNYAMTHILNIIVHIVKRFMCVTLFGTVIKGLSNFVVNEFPYNSGNAMYNSEEEYQQFILNIIVSTINDNGDGSNGTDIDAVGSRLLKYIFEVIPLKIVKVVLQIFKGPDSEFDPDRQETVGQILEHITKILESTSALNLSANNTLSSGLKLYVFPYYADYMELFVKEMFNLITNYLRSLQYQAKSLDILESITSKAVQEMNRIA